MEEEDAQGGQPCRPRGKTEWTRCDIGRHCITARDGEILVEVYSRFPAQIICASLQADTSNIIYFQAWRDNTYCTWNQLFFWVNVLEVVRNIPYDGKLRPSISSQDVAPPAILRSERVHRMEKQTSGALLSGDAQACPNRK